jgi:hypothetical protein
MEKTVSEWMAGEEAFPLAAPEIVDVPVPDDPKGAAVIWKNIAAAVRENKPLIAPGSEAWAAVEFANAVTISHFTGKEVKFPVDRQEYDTLLQALISKEKRLK